MVVSDFFIGDFFGEGFDFSVFDRVSVSISEQFGRYVDSNTLQELFVNSPFFAPLFIHDILGNVYLAFSSEKISVNPYTVFILYRPELSLQENLENLTLRFVSYY